MGLGGGLGGLDSDSELRSSSSCSGLTASRRVAISGFGAWMVRAVVRGKGVLEESFPFTMLLLVYSMNSKRHTGY